MLFSPRFVAQSGLAAAFVVLALSVSALIVVPRRSRPIAPADVGMPAPDFQLSNADGQLVKLSSFRGETVVLFFGSLHCPKTAGYNERIDRLAHAYANDSRVKFLALDVPLAGEAAPDKVRVRVDARLVGRPFQTLLDSHGAVAARYSADQTPLFVVIDPSGKVAYRGPFDDSQDIAFVTHRYLPDALQNVLGAPTRAVAQAIR